MGTRARRPTKKNTAPYWFTPGRYSELQVFTCRQWAALLHERLEVEALLQKWESVDQTEEALDEESPFSRKGIVAAIGNHFSTLADQASSLLPTVLANGHVLLPDVFSNGLRGAISPLPIGEAVMLELEVVEGIPGAAASIDALRCVAEIGIVMDGNGVRDPLHLSPDELEILSRPINETLICVDLARDRSELMKAFGAWLDHVRPGGRASAQKRGLRTKNGARMKQWLDWALLPFVDLDHWERWSRRLLTDIERVEILKAFVNDDLRKKDRFDVKRLRTCRKEREVWLSEDMLARLLVQAKADLRPGEVQPFADVFKTDVIAARGMDLKNRPKFVR